ncbi:oxidoreductase [Gryllotalpicola protaetiae]|uniref:Oxidoreductase n=1 Tax=Gryllotalpicola protaetiae TaxID=2419771 RepID=A0A387BMK5_9MICO|nr:oxidoreductase [Gryllotalpicola protaetiae]AYG03622.1 oxidoreductase [Gryllotalpicola protaetiae]
MTLAGGTLTLASDLTVTRMGYGAMQLPGPGVWGPPRDRDEAIAVLRAAVEAGVTHIDTADFYGFHVSNDLIREALHPYADELHLVTKVGASRTADGGWVMDRSPEALVAQVHDNLTHLGLETIDVVNLRMGTPEAAVDESVADQLGALVELRQQGKITHLGLSQVTDAQLTEALSISPIVTVQSLYNLVRRGDEPMLRRTAGLGIAYVPYFPLGGFTPLQSGVLASVAERLGASPQQVALAWLLQRSPNIALIPGTSSRAHLAENIAAASLELPADAVAELDAIESMAEPVRAATH